MSATTLPEAWAKVDALATEAESWHGPLAAMKEHMLAVGVATASGALAGAAVPASTAAAIPPPTVSRRIVYE